MARRGLANEQVRSLIVDGVVPAFAATGSVAAAAKLMNDRLAEVGVAGKVHPNRLHALLSDDPSRGVNNASFAIISAAVSALSDDAAIIDVANGYLGDLRDKALPLMSGSSKSLPDVATRLDVPPAVLRVAMEHGALKPHRAATPISQQIRPPGRAASSPDWSYQDTAVLRVMTAFRRHRGGRIGLVLPTGAGKTRTALRIVLETLKRSNSQETVALWVTHRKYLRTQAMRELKKLLEQQPQTLPPEAIPLAARIQFVMVNEASRRMSEEADAKPIALVVIDEAHHAAAPSYRPILDAEFAVGVPALLLTATPNRGDGLSLGMDEVAYSITYRELRDRGAVLMPEFIDFPVDDFQWSTAQVRRLCNFLLDETAERFSKTLVMAPRIERVEDFYHAFIEQLERERYHPLRAEDVGFIHGSRNSLGIDNEDFLARFAQKPKALIVSAQLLLEGFDDPAIDAVVMTYPTSSVIRLMQAAGRCVRYAPGKTNAYVVQSRNDEIAYHFDQRWLVEEISDYLRPELLDRDFTSLEDLNGEIADLLDKHNVRPVHKARVVAALASYEAGETVRVLLFGYPYFGPPADFVRDAGWGAFAGTPEEANAFTAIFNRFCAEGANRSDPSSFLERMFRELELRRDPAPGSLWSQLFEILTAAYLACEEVHGAGFGSVINGNRPERRFGPTTWLKYATFTYRPLVDAELAEFLADCHNRLLIEAELSKADCPAHRIVKVPLPLQGSEAMLLDDKQSIALDDFIAELRSRLLSAEPGEQFGILAGHIASSSHPGIPPRLAAQSASLAAEAAYAARTFQIRTGQPGDQQP